MSALRRELAPITSAAWADIDDEAASALRASLTARRVVDFEGPLGWGHSVVDLGRVSSVDLQTDAEGLQARLRQVQPLVELRVPFVLSRAELDAIDRGADDADLDPVGAAARVLARAEDHLVFEGSEAAGIRGLCAGAAGEPLRIPQDLPEYPGLVSEGLKRLHERSIEGPFAMLLGPDAYEGLERAVAGGYPVLRHVQRLLDGPILRAPALDGAVVLSLRGGDFRLTAGRDIAVGYLDHDAEEVRLYLEESLTFRLLTPEAAVPVRAA